MIDLLIFGVDAPDGGLDEFGEDGSELRSLDYKKPDSDNNLRGMLVLART